MGERSEVSGNFILSPERGRHLGRGQMGRGPVKSAFFLQVFDVSSCANCVRKVVTILNIFHPMDMLKKIWSLGEFVENLLLRPERSVSKRIADRVRECPRFGQDFFIRDSRTSPVTISSNTISMERKLTAVDFSEHIVRNIVKSHRILCIFST